MSIPQKSVHTNGATKDTAPPDDNPPKMSQAYERVVQSTDAYTPWEGLTLQGQLHLIVGTFQPPRTWLDEERLAVLAQFRMSPPGIWGQICERYREIGGNARHLEEEVEKWLRMKQVMFEQESGGTLAGAIVSFEELMTLTVPPREAYRPWLHERSLVMLYGPRGVGKTMALLGLAVSLASGRAFLRWPGTLPIRVLYVDGEMAIDELRSRASTLSPEKLPPQIDFLSSELVFTRSGVSLTLTSEQRRHEIETILEQRPEIKVLVLDNISCLFPGISEDKKQDWEPINAWLISLRHRGITVILGHHAGKSGQQRGTSAREDALDTVIALSFPPNHRPEEGCHFYWRFEKSRGVHGETVAGMDVRLEQVGSVLEWTYAAIEVSRTEQVKTMLGEGIPPKVIGDELGVHLSYVYRLKKQLGL